MKGNPYEGKIQHSGNQVVQVSQKSGAGKKTVHTGKDLRSKGK